MARKSWLVLSLGAALLSSLPAGPAATAPEANASVFGELRVGEQTVALRHGYALELDDVEGMRLQGTPKKSIVLQFSDVELPPAAVRSWSQLTDLARAGKLHGVEIRVDPARAQMYGGAVYCSLAPNEPPNLTLTVEGKSTEGSFQLQDLKISQAEVSGTALMPEASTWPRFGDDAKPTTFQYRVTFRLPLQKQPAVTGLLTGPAAQKSPVVTALLAFEAACRKGDLAAARKMATPAAAASWDALIAKAGEKQFRQMLQSSAPDAKARRKGLLRVVLRGERATAIFRETGGITGISLRKRNGTWLIDEP